MKTTHTISRLFTALVIALALVLNISPLPASAFSQSDSLQIISKGSSGFGADNSSQLPNISADGTRMSFMSYASDMVPGHNGNPGDLYYYDASTDTITLITKGTSSSYRNAISADGTKIAFESGSTDLIPGITTVSYTQIFLYDIATATISLVSKGPSGTGGSTTAVRPSISGDGSKVAYISCANDLVPGVTTSGNCNIYLYDVLAGTTTLVTRGPSGTGGNNYSDRPFISADGSTIAFQSTATDLIPGQSSCGCSNVFLYDVATGVTTEATDAYAEPISISADGSRVSFWSGSHTNFIPGKTLVSYNHSFVYDRPSDTIILASKGPAGLGAGGNSHHPALSGDGRFVAFISYANDLIPGVTTLANGNDIFLYDIENDTTELLSAGTSGLGVAGFASMPSLNYDGSRVAFMSVALDLSPDFTPANTSSQIYLWTRTTFLDITFDAGNGDELVVEVAIKGEKVTKPVNPTREGYTFAGWYTAKEGGVLWNFNDPVTTEMTLYGRWTTVQNTVPGTPNTGAMSGFTISHFVILIVATTTVAGAWFAAKTKSTL